MRKAFIPRQFGWLSVTAMILVSALFTLLNAGLVGLFHHWRGWPFHWYTWNDWGAKSTYYWWALVADAAIALAVTATVGILTQIAVKKCSQCNPGTALDGNC